MRLRDKIKAYHELKAEVKAAKLKPTEEVKPEPKTKKKVKDLEE